LRVLSTQARNWKQQATCGDPYMPHFAPILELSTT
jgi:hypothetical protein